MLYSIRNLKMIYDGRTVLDLPELYFEQGKIYALLGPNGSGKTTLLSVLSFLNRPTTGTVFYRDRPVIFAEKALRPLRREVILVNQHPILFSTSVYKNVEFGLRVRNVPGGERPRLVEEALDRVGMRAFLRARGENLSGGETQRVAIARALACSPAVMLFDEPTASVDVSSQITIENIIRELHADAGMTILLSTHNLFQASRLAQEKVFLFQGRASGSTYENIFGGRAAVQDGEPVCLIDDTFPIPLPEPAEGLVQIAINPKSIKLLTPEENNGTGVFSGTVFQLSGERDRVRVIVDIGMPLSVLLKQKEYSRRNIRIGDTVRVRCPAYGVRLI